MDKHLFLFSVIFLTVASPGCKNNSPIHNTDSQGSTSVVISHNSTSVNEGGAFLSLETACQDFGVLKIKKNPFITVNFNFVNTGNVPLLILKTDVSCSCLSTDYPKTVIEPGEDGVITVTVDTKNQRGVFNKLVFLKSNASNDIELIRIKGELK